MLQKKKEIHDEEDNVNYGVDLHHAKGVHKVYLRANSPEEAAKKAKTHISTTQAGIKDISHVNTYDINRERPHSVNVEHTDASGRKHVTPVIARHGNTHGAKKAALHYVKMNTPAGSTGHKVLDSTPQPKET